MNRALIEKFAAGGQDLREAVAGLTRDDLLATPGPGEWSIQQLVIHLADSDAIAIDRMKRVITEEHPTLLSSNETAYVRELVCDEQSIEDAVLLFQVGRRQFVRVLRNLPDASFGRVGMHNTRGRVTLEGLVAEYTEHLEHHLKFLCAKRDRLGKPVQAVTRAEPATMKDQALVVLRSRGPAWDDSKPLEGQSEWAGHAAFMDALFDERFAALVGPLQGTRDALIVFRASSVSEVIERLASDPWTINGLLVTTQISPWQIRLGTLG